MSNGKAEEINPWERLFKLWAMICRLLLDGKRSLERVMDALQEINDKATLAERITACKLDWFNDDILKWRREDAVPTTLGEVELLDLGRDISTEDAEKEIAKRGYDSANIEELCDYGAQNPDVQRKNPIVALKSVFVDPRDCSRYSPCLCERGRRGLGLFYRDGVWDARYRFAVVRKGARKPGSGR